MWTYNQLLGMYGDHAKAKAAWDAQEARKANTPVQQPVRIVSRCACSACGSPGIVDGRGYGIDCGCSAE